MERSILIEREVRVGEAGRDCVSWVVCDQVRDKLDFSFVEMGERQVKNIARPVRAHRILVGAGSAREWILTRYWPSSGTSWTCSKRLARFALMVDG